MSGTGRYIPPHEGDPPATGNRWSALQGSQSAFGRASGASGGPAGSAYQTRNVSALRDNGGAPGGVGSVDRDAMLLGLSPLQVMYILNKINWRLVNILCNLSTDALDVCIGKIDDYFQSFPGKKFHINLATIMGAAPGLGASSATFLQRFFTNDNGTQMTEDERQAYFRAEWPTRSGIDFDTFIGALRDQKRRKNSGEDIPTLRVGLQAARGRTMGYIHIFGHGSGASDPIQIHCTYEGFAGATGIHFTDRGDRRELDRNGNPKAKHIYCNLLGYALTDKNSEKHRVAEEASEAYTRFRDRVNRHGQPSQDTKKMALCSTRPDEAIYVYRALKPTEGIPIPLFGTDKNEVAGPLGIAAPPQSGAVGGPGGAPSNGAGPATGPAAALSPANAVSGAGPAPAPTGMQQYLGANAFIPMSQRAVLASAPGYPTGVPLPAYPTVAPPGYPTGVPLPGYPTGVPLPGYPTGAPPGYPTGAPPGYPTGAPPGLPFAGYPTGVPLPGYPTGASLPGYPTGAPLVPKYPVYNATGNLIAFVPYGTPLASGHFVNVSTPYYGGKHKTLRRKKRTSKQTRHRKRKTLRK